MVLMKRALSFCFVGLMLGAAAVKVEAAELTVSGDTLHGTVVGASADNLLFQTIYAEEVLTIPWALVENLTSDATFQVLHGDTGEVHGRVIGIDKGDVLIGDSPESAAPVPVSTLVGLYEPVPGDEGKAELVESLRSDWRHWSGNIDLNWGLTRSTVDGDALGLAMGLVRRRAATRLFFNTRLNQATQTEATDAGDEETVTADEYFARARGEYDVRERLFVYLAGDGLYDGVQRLSLRSVASTGFGYRLYDLPEKSLSFYGGPAWQYERFFGGDTNDSAAVTLGMQGEVDLPYAARFSLRSEYLSAFEALDEDYLLRTEAALAVPLFSSVSLKAALQHIYDNTPADGTKSSSLISNLGLSLGF